MHNIRYNISDMQEQTVAESFLIRLIPVARAWSTECSAANPVEQTELTVFTEVNFPEKWS